MAAESVWSLPYAFERALPDRFAAERGVRFPPTFVERALREFSEPGDVVLDPFAGFGTTLAVAARLDRRAAGVELEPERAAFVRDRLPDGADADVRTADLFDLEPDALPAADCVVTSPPFMTEGMRENPFENYRGRSDYAAYLTDLREAVAGVAEAVAPGGTVAVEVANIRVEGAVTTLAWDVAEVLTDVRGLRFRGEVVVEWRPPSAADADDLAFEPVDPGPEGATGEGAYGVGFDHSYCLVFDRE